jgi:hypothetical protein
MTENKEQTRVAYKGFDKGYVCGGYQYKKGVVYEQPGETICCKSGFHACGNPLEVLAHYAPGLSVYAKVRQSGTIIEQDGSSFEHGKATSSKIQLLYTLNTEEYVNEVSDYVQHYPELFPNNTLCSKEEQIDGVRVSQGYSCFVYAPLGTNAAIARGSSSIAKCADNKSVALACCSSSIASAAKAGSTAVTVHQECCAVTHDSYSAALCFGINSLAECYESFSIAAAFKFGTVVTHGAFSAAVAVCDGADLVCEGVSSIGVSFSMASQVSVGEGSAAVAFVYTDTEYGSSTVLRAKENGCIVFLVMKDADTIMDVKVGIVGRDIKPDVYYKYDIKKKCMRVAEKDEIPFD